MAEMFGFLFIWNVFFETFLVFLLFSFLAPAGNTLQKSFTFSLAAIILGDVLKLLALDPFATLTAEIIGLYLLVNFIYDLPMHVYILGIIYFKITFPLSLTIWNAIFGFQPLPRL